MKSVTVIGCGWVGRAIKEALSSNYKVFCLVKSKTKDSQDYTLTSINDSTLELFSANSIIISIPARGDYLEYIESFSKLINPKSQIILLSSTSVYPKVSSIFSEDSKNLEQNLTLKAEEYLKDRFNNIVILRLGGLMGYNRVSGKYTEDKTLRDYRVNYIHLDDVVAIIKKIIQKDIRAKLYNLVAPKHPMHSLVTTKNVKKFGFKRTKYSNLEPLDRVILSIKVEDELNYTFLKPNPLEFWD